MFDKMTKRERILALVVASTLPFVLLFAYGFWVMGSYNSKRARLRGMESQIRDQKNKAAEIENARYRRMWYQEISLPSDLPVSQSDYKFLLTKMVEDKLQKNGLIKLGKDAQPVKFKGRATVFHQMSFTISAKDTTLEKLVEFLYDFRSRKILHRIVGLTINPKDVKTGNVEKRTDRLSVQMKVEAIALVDAEEHRDFSKDVRKLDKTVQQYKDVICFRDIFGLPNNAPSITTSSRRNFIEGEQTDISISATDPDGDKLDWEIISRDSELDSLKMTKKGNSIRLVGPKFPANSTYRFKAKVTDNGCPAKYAIKEFIVNVDKKKVVTREKKEDPPPRPKFQHARGTRITGMTKNTDGTKQVFVYVGTQDITHSVKVGDSFELDGFKWTVKSIDIDKWTVVICRDDEEFVYTNKDKSLFRPLPKKVSKDARNPAKTSRFGNSRKGGKSGTSQN